MDEETGFKISKPSPKVRYLEVMEPGVCFCLCVCNLFAVTSEVSWLLTERKEKKHTDTGQRPVQSEENRVVGGSER